MRLGKFEACQAFNLKTNPGERRFPLPRQPLWRPADIFRCGDCGFVECANQADVLSFYEELQDPSYEEGRTQRSLQQKKLLELLPGPARGKRLIDIGAGSGMLVEQAIHLGYQAEGDRKSVV